MESSVAKRLKELAEMRLSPLNLLPHDDLREKCIDLVLSGEPVTHNKAINRLFASLAAALDNRQMEHARVVVFGGGTGLSNIIGGDSRSEHWTRRPFSGLKEVFPQTRSVVCVTDDGGSTGELLKDLPLIAIGDIRHVLLSSIQLAVLQRTYQLSIVEARQVAAEVARLFNYRFKSKPTDAKALIAGTGADTSLLPRGQREVLESLIQAIFVDPRLSRTLDRSHCLGNLIIVAAIYRFLDSDLDATQLAASPRFFHEPLAAGLQYLALALGTGRRAVLPCTTTPCQLRVVYTNGIQTTGESKSSGARRGFPVESVHVDFCDEVRVYPEIIHDIEEADILILAPGSLYSSIIPVFKVPGLADAVRRNRKALKLLISNLWVQAGETDLSITDPERKFRVSDMIRAYERNIPGGTSGLFNEVLCLSLKDVPASVIQRYAVEGKIPIYLDRDVVRQQGYIPVECGIYSKEALADRGVIQHDPDTLATAVRVLYAGSGCFSYDKDKYLGTVATEARERRPEPVNPLPSLKYQLIAERLAELHMECSGKSCCCYCNETTVRNKLCEIIWKHHDIPLTHLEYITGVCCVELESWPRDQQWDNVYSFYDIADGRIKIRRDQFSDLQKLEVAFLIALGESLLGNYALTKEVCEVVIDNLCLGKVYHLFLREQSERRCFLSADQLDEYLRLTRMFPGGNCNHYTRLINGEEGFTPPGLYMGLMYAWYLENRLASHIEYKMTVMKIPPTDLIPEQKKMVTRRKKLISFFREVVFCKEVHNSA